MPRLDVISPEDEVVASFEFVGEPGATVSIAGFHGSQVYSLTAHDTNMTVRFTGVSDFQEAAAPAPQVQKEAVEGEPQESESEQAQREAAEATAAANDAKAAKGQQVVIDDGVSTKTVTITPVETGSASAKKPTPQPAKAANTEK
jgi:hypothetical protein